MNLPTNLINEELKVFETRFKDADFPLLSGLYKEMTDGYLPVISVVLSVDPSMIKMN